MLLEEMEVSEMSLFYESGADELRKENDLLRANLAQVEDRERKLHESYDSLSQKRADLVEERDKALGLLAAADAAIEDRDEVIDEATVETDKLRIALLESIERLAAAERKYGELQHVVDCNKKLLIENYGLRLSLAAAEREIKRLRTPPYNSGDDDGHNHFEIEAAKGGEG